MRVGLQLPHFRPSTPQTMGRWFAEIAQAADSSGFYSMFVMDHFFQIGRWLGEPENPMVEGYTTLGYLAGVTQHLKLGLMVGAVIYRYPAVVIKSISTLDVLSGGRAYFSIGAAWNEYESVSLGLYFPPLKERFEQLEDILRMAHHMWSADTSAFKGKHVYATYPYNNPQPLSKPHPPILIGGMGRTKTLRYIAQYGDACNFFAGAGDESLKEHLAILRTHCAEVGRPYEEIEKTTLLTIRPNEQSMEQIYQQIAHLNELGFSHAIMNVNGDYTPQLIEELAQKVVQPAAAL
jgi:F420-dependent oxidoreductase-like protein